MHDPIPTGSTPTAVPWTPDMMAPQVAPAAPVPAPIPAPVQNVAPVQQQYQAAQAPAPAPQYRAPQPAYAQPAAPQPYAPVAQPAPPQHPHHQVAQPAAPLQAFAPQPQMQSPQAQQPHMPSPQMAQPHMHAAPHAPAVQPAHRVPAPQMAQPQYVPAPAAPQFPQAATPQSLAPHMQVPQHVLAAPVESKSFIAKLLKRSPKPEQTELDMQTPMQSGPAKSGSLFNKNFAIGAVAGLVVGAFVLPMVLGLFGGDAPVQTQAQAQAGPLPGFDINSPTVKGDGFKADTFIDNAIAADAP